MPSAKKWKPLGISTCVSPKKWMTAPGTTAHAASRASRETVRCRRRRPIRVLSAPLRHLLRHHVRVAIDFEAEGLLDGTERPGGAARASAHARERGIHARGAARGGRSRPAGAAAGGARARRRGQALHAARSSPRRPASSRRSSTEAARALGVPVREPGERAITEEELELSRSAKALLDAGLAAEAFLELTAVMSRSMANIAASFTWVFGEALLHDGRHRARPRPALRRDAPQPRAAGRPDARADVQPPHARADARGRGQPGRAPDRPPGRQRSRSPSGSWTSSASPSSARTSSRRSSGRWCAASSARSPRPSTRPCKLVKTIGDAAMLVAPEPGPVVATVLGLVERSHGRRRRCCAAASPRVTALPRAGDWYGRPVNLAARLTGFAQARQRRGLEGGARGLPPTATTGRPPATAASRA